MSKKHSASDAIIRISADVPASLEEGLQGIPENTPVETAITFQVGTISWDTFRSMFSRGVVSYAGAAATMPTRTPNPATASELQMLEEAGLDLSMFDIQH